MKAVVLDHYNDREWVLEGGVNDLEHKLLDLFPWLQAEYRVGEGDLEGLVERVDGMQMFSAWLEHVPEITKSEPNLGGSDFDERYNAVAEAMLGSALHLAPAFQAAKFLMGGKALSVEQIRRALWEEDGDTEAAALRAYQLEVNERNLAALRAILQVGGIQKFEPTDAPIRSVIAALPDAEVTATSIQRAVDDQFVMPLNLGGKHSAGALLARDHETQKTWLLKPGSGGQSPAAGAKEEPASQSRREAAFWHVAEALGLGQDVPRADLLFVDGSEWAALELLPWDYETVEKERKENASRIAMILESYRKRGRLHQWAVLDYLLGNPDRHAQNVMVDTEAGRLSLIDHGSAFAGDAFDPAHDQNSFIPFYLRSGAPARFHGLAPDTKLRYMPRLDPEAERVVRVWLDGIHADRLEALLHRYGVRPEPVLMRLAKLKAQAGSVDLAINRLWAGAA